MIRLKTGDVARLLATSKETVIHMEGRGELPPAFRLGTRGDRIWDWADLQPWLEQHGMAYYPPTTPPTRPGRGEPLAPISDDHGSSLRTMAGAAVDCSNGG
jgi:predicted DNA-binding transcriptional regulator AlpA